jgi:hypothetical protein
MRALMPDDDLRHGVAGGAKRPIEYILIAIRAHSFAAALLHAGDGMIRWEYAFVDRAGRSDQAGPLKFGFRDKTDDFAHRALQGRKNVPLIVGLRSAELEDVSPSQELISRAMLPCEKPTSFSGPPEKNL